MPRQPKRAKSNNPSMHDVARLAGVSQTTVSFVVNSVASANIPEETQARVWAAIKELGYRPNAMARSLRSQRSHTIGFLSDEIATTPDAGKIIQGAQDAAWAGDKMLLVINTGSHADIENAAVEMLLERQVEGIVYATMYHRPVTPPPALSQVPVVLLNCYVEDRSDSLLRSTRFRRPSGAWRATSMRCRHRTCCSIHSWSVRDQAVPPKGTAVRWS